MYGDFPSKHLIKKDLRYMETRFCIDYPQEKIEPNTNNYQCKFCKKSSLEINGLLKNHDVSCEYRISKEAQKL